MAKGAVGRLPLLGLVMVVKNEAERIERALASVAPHIDTWTISDTGSTDDTKKLIRKQLAGIPGRLYDHTWRDFGHNRTLALARARGTARWLLMMDADEELTFVNPTFRRWLGNRKDTRIEAYDVLVQDHEISYHVPYLTRGDLELRYVGVTHEYLKRSETHDRQKLTGIAITHHGKDYDQSEKLHRDIALLLPEFRAGDPRAIFYTAQSHRFLGNNEQAALIYEHRAKMDGFEEEAWYSSYQAAALRKDVERLIEVWRERPWRHEPLTAAAKIIAENANAMGDVLFVERPPR
jgi:glycosyltransferase involved in cell wall biosynthesis